MRLATLAAAISSAALGFATPAFAGDTLPGLLAAITDAASLEAPLVAEGKAEIDGIKGKVEDHVVIVERAAKDANAPEQILVAFDKAKTRLLSLGPSPLLFAAGGKTKTAGPDEIVTPSSFSAEDFLPFQPERCAVTRIADLSDEQFTILCEPKKPPSQYMLMVYKFDREMAVPRQILLYKDTNTNLVRMVKSDDFTQVGKRWRPKRVVLQDFKLQTRDTLSLEWRVEPKIPAEAFDPKSFAAAPLPAAAKAP